MERKTKVTAEEGKQDLWIIREFDLSVELLFRAYEDAEIVAQWMGTRVVKLESKKHGSYQFETSDQKGYVFSIHGAIHEHIPNQKIIRTFQMENMPFGVQLEIIEFERLTDSTSKLLIHTIYESVSQRDEQLKLPFVQGINMAHDRLEKIISEL